MEAIWHTPRYQYWQYPKPVPPEMVRFYEMSLRFKKRYAAIWDTPKDNSERGRKALVNDEQAFERLGVIVRRGYFQHTDAKFIREWQQKMNRKQGNTSLAGILSCIKWCGIPASGFQFMQKVLMQAAFAHGKAVRITNQQPTNGAISASIRY